VSGPAPGLAPTYTALLFAPPHAELLALLRGLAPAQWDAPTVAGAWRVPDVAAHLLDGDLRMRGDARVARRVVARARRGGLGARSGGDGAGRR
jgi:hypothetical protein